MLLAALIGEIYRESVTSNIYISAAITLFVGLILRFITFGKKGRK